jgi:Uma2 family endonuclease
VYGSSGGRNGLTVEEFERLTDDDSRCELVRGLVVREPPAGFEHGRTCSRVDVLLRRHAEAHGLGEVCGAETGFVLSVEPALVRAPDAAFVVRARLPAEPVRGFFRGAPDLAVEIVSPSNAPALLAEKVADYLAAGTRVVWVLDPQTRTVAVHDADGVMLLSEADELDGGRVLPGLRARVATLFGST